MKPLMKRILLQQYVGSYEVQKPVCIPIFILSPIFREVDPRLGTQSAEYSH